MVVEDTLQKIKQWAETNQYVNSVLLVGSQARGDAKPDSDIDIVVLCSKPRQLLYDTHWVKTFGEVERYDFEDWGKAQTIRTFYKDGMEIEFGITTLDWADIPPDPGTQTVISGGTKIILDKTGLLTKLLDT
jgi:predicted nucleotidyltransferase